MYLKLLQKQLLSERKKCAHIVRVVAVRAVHTLFPKQKVA